MRGQNLFSQIIELGNAEFIHYYYSQKSMTNDSDIANLKERLGQWLKDEKISMLEKIIADRSR